MFAIVCFTAEEDSTGIIPTNWMNYDQTFCSYPKTSSDEKKNALVEERADPQTYWRKCPIRVHSIHDTLDEALSEITDAENATTWGSEIEKTGQNSSSEDERESQSLIQPLYPQPPEMQISKKKTSISNQGFSFQPKWTSTQKSLSQSLSLTTLQSQAPKPTSMPTCSPPVPKKARLETEKNEQNVLEEIKVLKVNQERLIMQMHDHTAAVLRLETKIDRLLSVVDRVPAIGSTAEHFEELRKVIPLSSAEGVEDLEEKLKLSNSLRSQLKQMLMGCHGKDCRGLAASCLRKVLSDEAAVMFSLTGRVKTCSEKLPFQNKIIYVLIKEVCLTSFKESKENTVRDAISDWLLQAKFRMARREKRISEENNQVF